MILEVNFKKLFFLFIFLNISCDFEPNYKLLKGSTFGTYYQVKFFEVDKNNSTIEKEIDSIFDHFNSSLSTYISSSIISKVNRNEKVIADDLFIDIFKKSKIIYEKTNGRSPWKKNAQRGTSWKNNEIARIYACLNNTKYIIVYSCLCSNK